MAEFRSPEIHLICHQPREYGRKITEYNVAAYSFINHDYVLAFCTCIYLELIKLKSFWKPILSFYFLLIWCLFPISLPAGLLSIFHFLSSIAHEVSTLQNWSFAMVLLVEVVFFLLPNPNKTVGCRLTHWILIKPFFSTFFYYNTL